MKALVALLGLITASLQTGESAVKVKIRAYNVTGEVTKLRATVPRGTRVLFTCDVAGLPEGHVAINYKWYHSSGTGRSEVQEDDPYYTSVNDTLLVDTISWGSMRRWHICKVNDANDFFILTLTDSSTPFIVTPTSLLPKHAPITDVQQIIGRNGQEWINCTSGSKGGSVHIFSVVDRSFMVGNRMNTAIIGPRTYPKNGLYYCSAGPTSLYYISLFLRNSNNLPTPTVSAQDTSMWTLTSPDGSQVERYIVEFECRVRNMTFVEKYMSVSVSEGTGQVATSVSCFGLGQLYRVKVWAVSGPNISRHPAEKVVTTVDGQMLTILVLMSTPTTLGSTGIPTTSKRYTQNATPSSGPEQAKSQPEGDQAGHGTFIGVGVGIGIFLLSAVLAVVGVIVTVVMVKRRTTNTKTGSAKMRNNPSYSNPVVDEMEVKGLGHHYEDIDKDKSNGSVVDGFDTYEDVDSKSQMKNTKKPAPKESSTPASATNVGELYAVVDKSKKKGAKKKQEQDGCTVTTKDDLYTVPMKKKDKMTDEGKCASGRVKKGEEYDDVAGLKYEPKVDSEPQQSSEGDNKAPNADILYAVVDRSHEKKK